MLESFVEAQFMAKRDGNIYVVEVKANEAKLAPLQRRILDLAAEHGFRTNCACAKSALSRARLGRLNPAFCSLISSSTVMNPLSDLSHVEAGQLHAERDFV